MIVSASYRTDIPAFYSTWLLRRLAEGGCRVRNPYGGADYEVSLREGEVDGFVFWSRNMAPLAPHLTVVRRRAPFIVQYTLTGYPRALETSVIDAPRAIAQIAGLAGSWGKRAVVWRYDPIVVTTLTPPAWHEANFQWLAAALAGRTDEVVVSFASPYRKTLRNLADGKARLAEPPRRHRARARDAADDLLAAGTRRIRVRRIGVRRGAVHRRRSPRRRRAKSSRRKRKRQSTGLPMRPVARHRRL